MADLLLENAVGTFPLPVGLAIGFRVDGEELVVPLATEEASVVAAASYGARLLADGHGGGGCPHRGRSTDRYGATVCRAAAR